MNKKSQKMDKKSKNIMQIENEHNMQIELLKLLSRMSSH